MLIEALSSQILVRVLINVSGFSIPTFVNGFHDNLDELAVPGSDYDVLACAESTDSDRRHISELCIHGLVVPNSGCGILLLVPRVWLCMLGKDSAPSGKASLSVLAMNPLCISRRINNFYVYAFHRNEGYDGSLHECLHDFMALVQSVVDKAVFVFIIDANAQNSEWLEPVSATDRYGHDAIFAICRVVSSWFAVPLTLLVTDSSL